MNSIEPSVQSVKASDPQALTTLLNLPDFIVNALERNDPQRQVVWFCEPAYPVGVCPACLHLSTQIHDAEPRRVRDMTVGGYSAYLEFTQRRFECTLCQKPFTEQWESIGSYRRYTYRYELYLCQQCHARSVRDVSRQEALDYHAIEEIYLDWVERTRTTPLPTTPLRRLGIDEIALRKGRKDYVLVLTDLERQCVLTVLPDRTKETLETYLDTWTPEQRASVEQVAMDRWDPYRLAVEAKLSQAHIVADRFHVMQNLTAQVTTARREIQRDVPDDEKEQLKGLRWILVKNAVTLNEPERAKLELMYALSPQLKQLHQLKESFRTIFETQQSRDQAATQLEGWITQVEALGVKSLGRFVGTLRNWWDYILNYFLDRVTSGFVEGMNNRLKLIKRRGYGYRNFEHFRLRVLEECGTG